MIELDNKAWYARWFLLWDRCWAEFTDGRGVLQNERTNLCTYFWVCVGAPVFVIATHLAVLAFVIWAVFIYGVTRLTIAGFLGEVALVASVVGLIWGLRKAGDWLASRPSKPKKPKPARPERGPSLLFQYLRAVKHRVCPIISVENES